MTKHAEVNFCTDLPHDTETCFIPSERIKIINNIKQNKTKAYYMRQSPIEMCITLYAGVDYVTISMEMVALILPRSKSSKN